MYENGRSEVMMKDLQRKYGDLKGIVRDMGSVLVAFSGGVDSTFLLKVSRDELGERAVAVTAVSPTYPARELREAESLASMIGCRHLIVESNELEIPGFSENSPRRCYFCKSELFDILRKKAGKMGIAHVVDGTNRDDLGDYRPGRDAAEEYGVRSPLVEAGMNKGDIRALSKMLGLPTWNKPSFACLSSRFPYGTEITAERVKVIETCEDFLRDLSLGQFRVRYHGEVARIEVDENDFDRMLSKEVRTAVVQRFKKQGFRYVSLDLQGYRTGSMNEAGRVT